RPSVQLARLIDRITARLAEHRPPADHRQLGEPLPRARETISLGDICRGVGAAEEGPPMRCRPRLVLHHWTSSSISGAWQEIERRGTGLAMPDKMPEIGPIFYFWASPARRRCS